MHHYMLFSSGERIMALEILRDEHVRSVEWRDLVKQSVCETIKELLLPLPWLAAFWWLTAHEYLVLALVPAFMFFLAGLRVVHNAYHCALGLPLWLTHWIMALLSVVMLSSMHAVQFHHLRHHKHCLDDEDVEAYSARLSLLGALAVGPWFPILLHWTALRMAPWRQRWRIVFELFGMAAWMAAIFLLLDAPWLRYHVAVMALGQCLTAFFAVWTVHHNCDRSRFIARTLRRRWLNLLSLNMFYHVEHHLFPRVPTCHLPRLAERLDRVVPDLKVKQVL
jgi:fatty acid desaturase